jgi:ureidoglycolate lyase
MVVSAIWSCVGFDFGQNWFQTLLSEFQPTFKIALKHRCPVMLPSIKPVPLTKAAFAAFGDVIEQDGSVPLAINQGFAERFNDLASIDVSTRGGSASVNLFTASPRPNPIAIMLMERHPLGSQMFYPLQDRPWLVLVCADPLVPASYRAFTATGRQGVNYARNVWHHPLLVLDPDSRFLIVDRKGPGNNLEEVWLPESQWLSMSPVI